MDPKIKAEIIEDPKYWKVLTPVPPTTNLINNSKIYNNTKSIMEYTEALQNIILFRIRHHVKDSPKSYPKVPLAYIKLYKKTLLDKPIYLKEKHKSLYMKTRGLFLNEIKNIIDGKDTGMKIDLFKYDRKGKIVSVNKTGFKNQTPDKYSALSKKARGYNQIYKFTQVTRFYWIDKKTKVISEQTPRMTGEEANRLLSLARVGEINMTRQNSIRPLSPDPKNKKRKQTPTQQTTSTQQPKKSKKKITRDSIRKFHKKNKKTN